MITPVVFRLKCAFVLIFSFPLCTRFNCTCMNVNESTCFYVCIRVCVCVIDRMSGCTMRVSLQRLCDVVVMGT